MPASFQRALGAAILVVALSALAPGAARAAGFDAPVRGIVLSTHTDGRDWASDGVPPALDRIRALGGNWVAIHPYAGIGGNGKVRFAPIDPDDPPDYLTRPIAEAHQRGLKVLIIPHLAYWGSPFRWRGEIGFDNPDAWKRFWTDYGRWIVTLARATRDAGGFVVGNEMARTLSYEQEWRALIADVRSATSAPLTYAANWNEFERVPFWDALDAIGVQAYFPLAEASDTSEPAIRAGWKRWMDRLGVFADARERPLLFTELGYTHGFAAPVRPWESHTDGEAARGVQATCMRVALEAVAREPRVRGVDGMLLVALVVAGYTLFILFINSEGARHFRLRAEVDLARALQSRLVPRVEARTPHYECLGFSNPSSEVGGDLVEHVALEGYGFAYVADVAGHGIPAGTFMGMVKAALHMRLDSGLDLGDGSPHSTAYSRRSTGPTAS